MASKFQKIRDSDYIEYFLFFDQFTNEINANVRQDLEEKIADCMQEVFPFIENYLWHKDKFHLVPRFIYSPLLKNEEEPYMPSHLYGITHYGENIADEWFIVFLLRHLTHVFPDLVARVKDDDGEFLLIEAADYLPEWANPSICENRVFIYQNKVHLIPISLESKNTYNILQGLYHIKNSPTLTSADENIQKAIEQRTLGYPDCIEGQLHRTTMYLPVGVAALLKKKPKIVARAVLAFCNRDILDTKLCKAMKYFPPECCTMVSVNMTRCLFAMLTHHKFIPDKRTGWKIPLKKDPHFNKYELGMKLASGFEILISQLKNNTLRCDDLTENKAWHLYLESLTKRGYFEDFLDQSQPYNFLLENAKHYFLSTEEFPFNETEEEKEILELSGSFEDVEIIEDSSSLPPSQDEGWLELCPQELDSMLEDKYGRKQFSSGEQNPQNLTSQLEKFLEKVSDLDGAEFPNANEEEETETETPPVRPKRGVKLNKKTTKPETTESPNRISFDPDSFTCAVNNILDLVVPEDNWDLESDDSAMSSYEDELDLNVDKLKIKDEGPRSELKQYMDQMDQELRGTAMENSFHKINSSGNKETVDDNFSDVEHFEPVDIDMNAVQNILESYRSEFGCPGPASNLLGPLGIVESPKFPQDKNE